MPTDTLIDGCSLPERFPSEESTLPNEASLEKEDTVVEGDDQNSWEAAVSVKHIVCFGTSVCCNLDNCAID